MKITTFLLSFFVLLTSMQAAAYGRKRVSASFFGSWANDRNGSWRWSSFRGRSPARAACSARRDAGCTASRCRLQRRGPLHRAFSGIALSDPKELG